MLSGLGWVEFVGKGSSNDFVVSNTAPILISTDFSDAALEVATLGQGSGDPPSALMLKKIADTLHQTQNDAPNTTVCAELMRWAAASGMSCLFEALVRAADEFYLLHSALSEADKGPVGLISLAAGSGDVRTASL
eukprot:scaffold29989_cov28-Prasinocladus_malaysianus.AAC.1